MNEKQKLKILAIVVDIFALLFLGSSIIAAVLSSQNTFNKSDNSYSQDETTNNTTLSTAQTDIELLKQESAELKQLSDNGKDTSLLQTKIDSQLQKVQSDVNSMGDSDLKTEYTKEVASINSQVFQYKSNSNNSTKPNNSVDTANPSVILTPTPASHSQEQSSNNHQSSNKKPQNNPGKGNK